MSRYKNHIGKKYDRLTVISFAGWSEESRKQKSVLWACDCDCGTKNHLVIGRYLVSKRVRSCGCMAVEHSRAAGIKRALPENIVAKRRLFKKYKCSAIKRKLLFDLTEEQFFNLVSKDCNYCGTNPEGFTIAYRKYLDNVKFIHNGIDRVNSDIRIYFIELRSML